MMSAAIAGVGGVLMSAQLLSVNPDRFQVFISLVILLLAVVGGIGYTSGALFAGLLFGCSIVAMQNTLTKLGSDYESIEAVFGFLVSAVTVMPATIGVTMGKNPSGAITDIVEGLERMKQSKLIMFTMIGLQAAIWGLAVTELISNWHFVIFTAANLLLVPPALGGIVKAQAMKNLGIEPPVPPELIGIDRAFTEDDRVAMEHALGLDGVPVPVATPLHHEEALHATS
jgi:branched-chain amino acid transport system permease protein